MLVNSLLYNTLLILLTTSFAIGMIIFFKKKFNNYYGILLAIIGSAVLFPFLFTSPGKMYVITKELEVLDYRFIGSTEHAVGSKTEVFEVDNMKVFVINNSDKQLVLEEIIYGGRLGIPGKFGLSENKIFYIFPNTSASFSLPKQEINFFFDEEIPKEAKVYGYKGRLSKYWLHLAD